MSKTKVIVLMGGASDEKEISLKSGLQVIENLDKKKYQAIPAIVGSDNKKWFLVNKKELKQLASKASSSLSTVQSSKLFSVEKQSSDTVVFIAMHGRYGEDGRIQGFLDLLGIPYTGSGVLASALGMDKAMFKKILKAEDIKTPLWTTDPYSKKIKLPCVIKPASSGSSVGISIAKNEKDFKEAISLAKKFDTKVLIEEYIEGTEISCGILGNKTPTALPVIEIRPKKSFFDYEAKYQEGMSEEICPAEISASLTKKVQQIAIKVFKAIGAKGFARVDMIIKNSDLYVLEINTIPGLTPQSLLPKEAAAAGISYSKLLDKMITLSKEKEAN